MRAVTLTLFCDFTYSAVAKGLNADGPISTNLKLIAAADGKSFFADQSVLRTWVDAGKYCTDLGMKFAEITSQAQYDALKAAYGPDFKNGHWTSGRDAYQPPPIAWNATGEVVSFDYMDIKPEYPGVYITCLYYYSQPDNGSSMYYTPCSRVSGVLCTT